MDVISINLFTLGHGPVCLGILRADGVLVDMMNMDMINVDMMNVTPLNMAILHTA
jgi:hypothetical protein